MKIPTGVKSRCAEWSYLVAILMLATSNAQTATQMLVSSNATWRYLITPAEPGTAWRQPAYNDSAWPQGPAQLGFGDGDEATVLTGMAGGTNGIVTAYFRRAFVVTNAAVVTNLVIGLLRDDGAAVFLNGVEVRRDNLPAGDINHFTLATTAVGGTDESTFFSTVHSPGALVSGTNVVAVEVHQNAVVSSDLSFALTLVAQTTTSTNQPPVTNYPPIVRLVSPTNGATFIAPTNLLLTATAFDPGTNGRVLWLEFYSGTNRLGVVTNMYSGVLGTNFFFEWMNAPTGTHVLTVRARDNQGAVSTSSPVAISVMPGGPSLVLGYLKWEVYTDIPGLTVADLTNHPPFPAHASFSSLLSSFETPEQIDDNFGARISGFVLPPVTGDYVFYLSSDDQGVLFLSSDEYPANKVQIAWEPAWSESRQWVGLGPGRTNNENISVPIPLEAGRRYYIEALHKEAGGGDHLGVAWQMPGELPPVNGAPPIPGAYLATFEAAAIDLAQALDAPELPWITGGDVNWIAQAEITHDSVDAAQSTVHAMEMQTWLATTVVGPGTVSFQWRIAGYVDYDHLTFFIGTNQVGQITTTATPPAAAPWLSAAFSVPPGLQTLRWVHDTPSEPIVNYSGAWLDEVRFVPSTLVPPTVAITDPTNWTVATLPTNLPVNVAVGSQNSHVSQIELFDGTNRIGLRQLFAQPAPPAQWALGFTWTNPPPGAHTLRALATDNDGLRGTSAPVNITIRSPTDTLQELHVVSCYSGTGSDGGPSQTNEQGHASIVVNRPGKHVTLFLSAAMPVMWNITVQAGTIIDRVILGGYHPQAVIGLGPQVAVECAYPGGNCHPALWAGFEIDSIEFYRAVPRIHALTGLEIASYHGGDQAPYPTSVMIDAVQNDVRLRSDYPTPTPLAELPALNFMLSFYPESFAAGGAAVFHRNHTLAGPVEGGLLLPGMSVVADGGISNYFGVQWQSLLKINPISGVAETVILPPTLPELSWPRGVTFDDLRQRVLLASLGGEGFLYAYNSPLNRWSLVASMNNLDFDCIAYEPNDDRLYGVEITRGYEGRIKIVTMSASGSVLGEIALPQMSFPVGMSGYRAELAAVGGYLVLLLEPRWLDTGDGAINESRIYLIDPGTSQVWLTDREIRHAPAIQITWPAPASITYGAPLSSAQLNATANVPGTFSYDPPVGTYLGAGTHTLSVAFTPRDWPDSIATATANLTVLRHELTIAADNKTKYAGEQNPPLTASYAGFVAGDDQNDLDTPVALTTTATSGSPPGQYAIIASGASDANYIVTHVNGTLTVLSVSSNCVAVPPGLVSWWRAETNAADFLGGNHGWMTNVSFSAGRVGAAFTLAGGGYVEVPDAPSLQLSNELTIEFWVRRTRLDEPHYIIEKGGDWTGGQQNFAVALHTGAYNHCLHFLFANGWRGGGSIADTNWHHCAVTARHGDVDPALYIDGLEQPIVFREGADTIALVPSTRPLHIGAQIDPITGWFYYHRGQIDELSLYRRMLSAAEIQSIYLAGNQGKCPTMIPSFPAITRQPTNQTRFVGQTALFSVIAVGATPLRYQWQFNNLALPGATNLALLISNVQPAHAGNYRVIVLNSFGAVTSAVATLTVVSSNTAIPVIASFTPANAAVGAVVTIAGVNFSATAASNVVFFGAVKAAVASASATTLTVTVPSGASYAPISVTVNGRTAWSRQPFGVTFAGTGQMNPDAFVTAEEDRSTGDGPVHVVAADLDGDGRPDLAVADRFANTLSLFRNVSVPGVLTPQSFGPRIVLDTGLNPTHLIAVDLDGDGRLDLVVVNADENTVNVFRNLGTGAELSAAAFAPRFGLITGANPYCVAAGDIDGDGKPDLAVANYAGNSVSILRNYSSPGFLGPSSFAPKIDWTTGAGAHNVAVGDLDGDGKSDIVVGCAGASMVSVFHNRAVPGSLTPASLARIDFPAGGKTVAIGDLDGDGRSDLATGSWSGNSVSLLRNTGTNFGITSNSFAPAVVLNTGDNTHTLALGDLDGDGKPDLAVVTEMESQLLLYHNATTPGTLTAANFSQRAELATGWNAVGVTLADFDLDGRLDVAFANHYDDTVRIYRNATGTDVGPVWFVQRQFPASAFPTNSPLVLLVANPPPSVGAYSAEDQPPAGWMVSAVTDGGVFDPRTGKVKFGPFFDAEVRALTYRVTPPLGFIGVGMFAGTVSADGVNSPIAGLDRLVTSGPHPADRDSALWTMSISEVTAYASAWRRGINWIAPPHVIPIDYVTRAAFLWRGGECYEIDPTATNAPQCWVNCGGADFQPVPAIVSNLPVARRETPAAFVPGEPLAVRLSVAPASVRAYAVEEQCPSGWTVAGISDSGEFDAATGRLRWGPFFDNTARTLSYSATPPRNAVSAANFTGVVSLDGASEAIAGACALPEGCRVNVITVTQGGRIELSVSGRVGMRFVVEASSDLVNWIALGEVTVGAPSAPVADPAAAGSPQRFYRARSTQ